MGRNVVLTIYQTQGNDLAVSKNGKGKDQFDKKKFP